MADQFVTQSAFAKFMGISRQAVHEAIQHGRITARSMNEEGTKLHLDNAKKEYVKNTDPNKAKFESQEKPKESGARLSDGMKTLVDLKREAVHISNAEKKHNLAVKMALYVEKKAVVSLMYVFGKAVKAALLKMDDKYIDDIISYADNREQARPIYLLLLHFAL